MLPASNILRPAAVPPEEGCALFEDAAQLSRAYGDYFTDESKLRAASLASLAFPESVGQLVWLLERSARLKRCITVSTGRTGVVGGAVAPDDGNVISMERHAGVEGISIDEDASCHVLRARAGTRLSEVDEFLEKNRPDLIYPVDPTERSAAVGGTVATNASGARSLRYGSTRDWVRWLRVVLAGGEVLELRRGQVRASGGKLLLEARGGRRVLECPEIPKPRTKNTIGYTCGPEVDAVDLFVGSEGTLGIVTDVELRLAPRPVERLYYLQFFEREEAAFDFIDGLRTAGAVRLSAVEFMDGGSLRLVAGSTLGERNRYARMAAAGASAAVYCEFELAGDGSLEAAYGAVEALLLRSGESIEHSGAGQEDKDLAEIKEFRHAIPEQVNLLIARRRRQEPALHKLSTDMAVEPEDLRWAYRLYRDTLERERLEYVVFGHAASGHLHVNVLARDAAELERTQRIYLGFAAEVVRRGGAVAGEHGIGRLKKGFLALQYAPEHLEAMRRIKRFFDPDGRLNPGVLFDGSERRG